MPAFARCLVLAPTFAAMVAVACSAPRSAVARGESSRVVRTAQAGGPAATAAQEARTREAGRTGQAQALELIECQPVGTTWDDPALRDAHELWLELFGAARASIDVAQFYVSDAPQGASRLRPVLDALLAAARRGIAVRLLVDAKFLRTYPQWVEELDAAQGIEARRLDLEPVSGGVMHAKYFTVDARDSFEQGARSDSAVAFLGSPNFDWRSLEHIQELGLCLRAPELVQPLQDVFELDWSLGQPLREVQADAGGFRPIHAVQECAFDTSAGPSRARFAASPAGLLPDPASWDLPQLVELIDGARERVRIQLLTYKASSRQDGYFGDLEHALRRAAARGVEVELLLADWCQRSGTIEGLKSLEVLPRVAVKLVSVPPAEVGFVPFARVVHAKYLVVDAERCWLGTSNWEGDYFHRSRNVGLIVEGGLLPLQLDAFFARGWERPEARAVDPCAVYEAPRIAE